MGHRDSLSYLMFTCHDTKGYDIISIERMLLTTEFRFFRLLVSTFFSNLTLSILVLVLPVAIKVFWEHSTRQEDIFSLFFSPFSMKSVRFWVTFKSATYIIEGSAPRTQSNDLWFLPVTHLYPSESSDKPWGHAHWYPSGVNRHKWLQPPLLTLQSWFPERKSDSCFYE